MECSMGTLGSARGSAKTEREAETAGLKFSEREIGTMSAFLSIHSLFRISREAEFYKSLIL